MDHSLTYKQFRLRNLPHRMRLATVMSLLKSARLNGKSWADVGCSNGFIVAAALQSNRPKEVVGFDHDVENLKIARATVPQATFELIDLNSPSIPQRSFDVVTCFETLEHVGNVSAALDQLCAMRRPGGTLLITVPVEVGLGGLLKYLIKRYVYGYSLNELPCGDCGGRAYFLAILDGSRISSFRSEQRGGWGTHFGFDWRDVEDLLKQRKISYSVRGGLFTRYFIVLDERQR